MLFLTVYGVENIAVILLNNNLVDINGHSQHTIKYYAGWRNTSWFLVSICRCDTYLLFAQFFYTLQGFYVPIK